MPKSKPFTIRLSEGVGSWLERKNRRTRLSNLRNAYTVNEEGGAYIVAGENQRGQRYECRVVPEAVDYLCDRTRGRSITAERAGGVIGPVAKRFTLPYTYGDQLRYSGQYVLLAAVALGRATVTKEGRSYVYSIKG